MTLLICNRGGMMWTNPQPECIINWSYSYFLLFTYIRPLVEYDAAYNQGNEIILKMTQREELRFTTTTSPTDNKGEGRDLGCKEPTNGMLPLSPSRREVFGLLDMIILYYLSKTYQRLKEKPGCWIRIKGTLYNPTWIICT